MTTHRSSPGTGDSRTSCLWQVGAPQCLHRPSAAQSRR